MPCWDGFGNLADGRPFWVGDFTGDGRDDVLFYSPGDDNWWLGSIVGSQLAWNLVGNTAGFGHQINDGRPFWAGDFVVAGKASILFYYPGDDNWWVGTLSGGQLQWTLAGNTAGFGHGINDGRPFWIGDFTGNGRADVLFYYPGDDNWWLGAFTGTQLNWSLVGNTAGFGHGINDGRPFWVGNFVNAARDSILFYYPGDDNWWVGTLSGGQLQWALAGNTAGFGHGINDGRPFWIGDFTGNGRADVLFYYPGDDNWWLGAFAGTQLNWTFAGNTLPFGHGINDGRPFWIGDFTVTGRDSVLFYYPGDDNWWVGTSSGTQLSWAFAGNTAGFGHGIDDGRPFFTGNFTGDGRNEILFYFPGDGNWWLGGVSPGNTVLTWTFAGNTGRRFDKCINLNLIVVAPEDFTGADFAEINEMLTITRGIYANVSLGIDRVEWYQIPRAAAGSFAIIDSQSEAEDLTSDWTVPNDAVDVFLVRSMNGADGWSAVGGSCDKDAKGMTGSVISLNGDSANSGNTLAHEVGHYLGCQHIPDSGNFIGGGGPSNSWTGIYAWQGDIMKSHCFAHG